MTNTAQTPRLPMSALPLALLVIALIVGGWLRALRLGADQLSTDEGDSWAAAAAPSLAAVVHLHNKFNPGKLPLDDIALHFWTRVFGDRETALRAPSAMVGTLAIFLVFFTARELLDSDRHVAGSLSTDERAAAAGTSALLFAVNPLMLRHSHEARMYSFQIAAEIAQMGFFFRAVRRGEFGDCIALGLLTALAVAENPTSFLLLLVEAVWLLYLLLKFGPDREQPERIRTRRATGAMLAGVALVAPFLPRALKHLLKARHGYLGWIGINVRRPAPWEPVLFFNRASGSLALAAALPLAAWGICKGWRAAPTASRFALLLMLGPILLLTAVSHAGMPILVDRYVLVCVLPFLILVSLGIWLLRPRLLRFGALAVAVALALVGVGESGLTFQPNHYSEAAGAAALSGCHTIYVAPDYYKRVIGYYLRAQRSAAQSIVGMKIGDGDKMSDATAIENARGCSVLIAGSELMKHDSPVAPKLRQRFPHVLGVFPGVEVRGP